MTGWWLTYPSEKYEFVKWDDDIPKIWKNKHVPNDQALVMIKIAIRNGHGNSEFSH